MIFCSAFWEKNHENDPGNYWQLLSLPKSCDTADWTWYQQVQTAHQVTYIKSSTCFRALFEPMFWRQVSYTNIVNGHVRQGAQYWGPQNQKWETQWCLCSRSFCLALARVFLKENVFFVGGWRGLAIRLSKRGDFQPDWTRPNANNILRRNFSDGPPSNRPDTHPTVPDILGRSLLNSYSCGYWWNSKRLSIGYTW